MSVFFPEDSGRRSFRCVNIKLMHTEKLKRGELRSTVTQTLHKLHIQELHVLFLPAPPEWMKY